MSGITLQFIFDCFIRISIKPIKRILSILAIYCRCEEFIEDTTMKEDDGLQLGNGHPILYQPWMIIFCSMVKRYISFVLRLHLCTNILLTNNYIIFAMLFKISWAPSDLWIYLIQFSFKHWRSSLNDIVLSLLNSTLKKAFLQFYSGLVGHLRGFEFINPICTQILKVILE